MRHGLLTAIALVLLGSLLGCHTHGVCDCDVRPIGNPDYGVVSGNNDHHDAALKPEATK
jgi:hypothetical protein